MPLSSRRAWLGMKISAQFSSHEYLKYIFIYLLVWFVAVEKFHHFFPGNDLIFSFKCLKTIFLFQMTFLKTLKVFARTWLWSIHITFPLSLCTFQEFYVKEENSIQWDPLYIARVLRRGLWTSWSQVTRWWQGGCGKFFFFLFFFYWAMF